jgi:hypothetical protein
MAAGVPATGIGGIFYILLSVVMFFYELIKRVISLPKKEIKPEKRPVVLTRIPPLMFIFSATILLYMNVTGFRFVVPGTQQNSLSIGNLWFLGVVSVSIFMFFLLLFHIRAKKLLSQIKGGD